MSEKTTNTLNQALVATAKTMFKEGYITEEQYLHFVRNYFFISWQPRSMWDKLRNRLLRNNNEERTTFYDVVKIAHFDDNESELELAHLRKCRQERL